MRTILLVNAAFEFAVAGLTLFAPQLLLGPVGPDVRAVARVLAANALALAVYSFLHAVTLFIGDILLSYAIFGLTLPALLRRSDRAVARMAGVAVAVALLVLVAIVWLIAADPAPLLDAALLRGDQELRTRGFLSAVPVRAALWPSAIALLAVINWPLPRAPPDRAAAVGVAATRWPGRRAARA